MIALRLGLFLLVEIGVLPELLVRSPAVLEQVEVSFGVAELACVLGRDDDVTLAPDPPRCCDLELALCQRGSVGSASTAVLERTRRHGLLAQVDGDAGSLDWLGSLRWAHMVKIAVALIVVLLSWLESLAVDARVLKIDALSTVHENDARASVLIHHVL